MPSSRVVPRILIIFLGVAGLGLLVLILKDRGQVAGVAGERVDVPEQAEQSPVALASVTEGQLRIRSDETPGEVVSAPNEPGPAAPSPPPILQAVDWSASRLPSHGEALGDRELNPGGRKFSLEEKKALAEFIRPRNVPIAMKALERDDRIHALLSAKIAAGDFESARPPLHEIFWREVPRPDGSAAFVALHPGESEEVDRLHAEIVAAIAAARAQVQAYIAAR